MEALGFKLSDGYFDRRFEDYHQRKSKWQRKKRHPEPNQEDRVQKKITLFTDVTPSYRLRAEKDTIHSSVEVMSATMAPAPSKSSTRP
jgi:hypothetical protein